MATWERIAAVSEIAPGARLAVVVDDTPALLLRVEDDFYCLEDVCSHDGQPLTNGPIQEKSIVCPRHGARFDLKTGQALCMPATRGIRVFTVEVRDGAVFAS